MYKGMLFDAEGIVIDTEGINGNYGIWDKATEEYLARRSVPYNRDELKPLLMGQSSIDGVVVMKELYGEERFEGSNQSLADERIEIAEEFFRTKIEFIPGFLDFYKSIPSNIKISIATSLNRTLLAEVNKKLDLEGLFGGHVYSIDDVGGISKPEPDIFLYAAKQLNLDPKECASFEDSPHGITSAKRAGTYCYAITTTCEADKLTAADMIVNSYNEIQLQLPY